MTKAEIEKMRGQFQKNSTAFRKYKAELEKLLTKFSSPLSFQQYSVTIKPDLDKVLFLLANLEIDCNRIQEDITIKKHLKKEFDDMQMAKLEAIKIKTFVEEKIPKK